MVDALSILDFRFRILGSKKSQGEVRPEIRRIQILKSKIQNGNGGTERTRTVIVFLDREVHTPFCHGPMGIWDRGFGIGDLGFGIVRNPKSEIPNPKSIWVERRGLNPHRPHSQCGALPVKLSPTYLGSQGKTRDIASPRTLGDKSEATFLLSYTSRWPELNRRPPAFYGRCSDHVVASAFALMNGAGNRI